MLFNLNQICYTYPDPTGIRNKSKLRAWAVKDFSLHIGRGEKLALLGANGSGKSTIMLHMNGLLKPSQGAILWNGTSITYGKKDLMSLRQQVALVFQDPDCQLFAGSLYEDVSFGPMNLGLDRNEIHSRVIESLQAVGLEKEMDLPLHMLSYGQRKRASIAGALAMQPQLLVLDEPTAGMDPRSEAGLLKILDELVQKGKTVVFSTHDVDLAFAWSSRVAILAEGILLAEGAPSMLGNAKLMEQSGLRLPYLLQGRL